MMMMMMMMIVMIIMIVMMIMMLIVALGLVAGVNERVDGVNIEKYFFGLLFDIWNVEQCGLLDGGCRGILISSERNNLPSDLYKKFLFVLNVMYFEVYIS